MKIIEKTTGKTVFTIINQGRNPSFDEFLALAGAEIINDMSDERWSDDGDNVIIDGVRYWYEDLVPEG